MGSVVNGFGSQDLARRFGGDLRNVFRRHHVACATPPDLQRLGEHLFTNAAFRSDLFALCSSISHMADEDLSAHELLELIASCYGQGLAIPEGVRRDFSEAYQGWSVRELALELPDRGSGGAAYGSNDRAAEVMVEDAEAGRLGVDESSLGADETLKRLSVSSMELKLYLQDVEQRVSEIEPHLEHMVSLMRSSTGMMDRLDGLPVIQAADAGVMMDRAGEGRSLRHLRVAVSALSAALLMAVACGAWMAWGMPGLRRGATPVRIVEGSHAAEGTAQVQRPAAAAQRSRPGAGSRPKPAAGIRKAAAARADGAAAGGTAGGAASAAAPAATHVPAPIVRVNADASGAPVYVPSSTMLSYALAAPKPVYPAVSVPDDKEGRVEVRATISPSGEVVATRVLSGPVVFREAADQAMKNWRFRPYLVDGTPVEVSTTVAFVFRSMPAT